MIGKSAVMAVCGLAALLSMACTSVTAQFGSGRFHGTVVDSATREPLKGVVITVIWWRTFALQTHSHSFLGARETLTDDDGHFSMSAAPPLVLLPLWMLEEVPKFIAYTPGYYPFPELESWSNLAEWLHDGLTIPLVKVTTAADRNRFININGFGLALCGGGGQCIPASSIPLLVRAVRQTGATKDRKAP
jgi:hypothetical protein